MKLDEILKLNGLSEIDNLAYRLYWIKNTHVYETSINFLKKRNEFKEYFEDATYSLRQVKVIKLKEIICGKK